jgi:phthiodiolone/phenolphthiodiolone dimycocerosates ketoreductase
MRLDSIMVIDHFQNVFPTAIWDTELTWLAAQRHTPNEFFDYQVLLGYLASRVGSMSLGVGVTEPIRRHPLVIAQAMMTLSHLTRRAPILGIGAGERMNIDPHGLDPSNPVARLDEALQIIRLCFAQPGPISFAGEHYRLDHARMDLKSATGRTPQIWIAGHGPRMLRLTGRYGDGWYPAAVDSPDDYANKLEVVRAAAAEAGRNPASITPALHRFMVVGRTGSEGARDAGYQGNTLIRPYGARRPVAPGRHRTPLRGTVQSSRRLHTRPLRPANDGRSDRRGTASRAHRRTAALGYTETNRSKAEGIR